MKLYNPFKAHICKFPSIRKYAARRLRLSGWQYLCWNSKYSMFTWGYKNILSFEDKSLAEYNLGFYKTTVTNRFANKFHSTAFKPTRNGN